MDRETIHTRFIASGRDLQEATESRRSLLPSGVLHKRLESGEKLAQHTIKVRRT